MEQKLQAKCEWSKSKLGGKESKKKRNKRPKEKWGKNRKQNKKRMSEKRP